MALARARLYNCWFTKANLVVFQSVMQKLGIIHVVTIDEALADKTGATIAGSIVAIDPNVWDELGPFLDPESGTLDKDGHRVNQTLIQKGGLDAHFVNIQTAVDLLPALTVLAQGDPTVTPIVQKPDDYFFTDVQGKLADDPTPKRVIL